MTEDNFFKESVRRAQAQQRVIWTVIALWLIATLAVCIFYGVATQKLKVVSQEAQKQLETIKKQLSDTQSAWRARQDYVSGIRSESAKQNEAFQVTLQGFESDASKSKASLALLRQDYATSSKHLDDLLVRYQQLETDFASSNVGKLSADVSKNKKRHRQR